MFLFTPAAAEAISPYYKRCPRVWLHRVAEDRRRDVRAKGDFSAPIPIREAIFVAREDLLRSTLLQR
jgi:hypothetical protein